MCWSIDANVVVTIVKNDTVNIWGMGDKIKVWQGQPCELLPACLTTTDMSSKFHNIVSEDI